jgi:Uma2 family endonuclease
MEAAMTTETVEEPVVVTHPAWTVDLLRQMPRVEGERYELINGELHVTTQPHTNHQIVTANIAFELTLWGRATNAGIVIPAPGLIYAKNEAVAPDVVWVSAERRDTVIGKDGKLYASPDLVIEVLLPGKANAERDREKKLELYSRRGVAEYWIADWQALTLEVYRPVEELLQLVATLQKDETLESPLLPGFACVVGRFFEI